MRILLRFQRDFFLIFLINLISSEGRKKVISFIFFFTLKAEYRNKF